ncbi:MAG: hypothetical protein RLZZ338_2604 [Cyanobacteriota bacterium]
MPEDPLLPINSDNSPPQRASRGSSNDRAQPGSIPPRKPGFLKGKLIDFLRISIDILEGWLEQLETAESDESATFFEPVIFLWQGLIRQARSLLPSSLNRQLSDNVIGGVITFILVIFLGISLKSLPEKTTVATNLPTEEIQPTEIKETPTIAPTIIPTIAPCIAISPTPDAIVSPELPPPVEEDKKELEVKETIPESPLEEKPIVLPETPEPYLITRVKNQIVDVTKEFGEGLIKSVQPNFSGGLLKVKISDIWYELSDIQQTELVNKILEEAQNLDFTKLDILNNQDKTLARSSIRGEEMIILERRVHKENSELLGVESL